MSAWSGRRVRRIVAMVLHLKGTTCHLCGLPGADSADHDPPRSVLLAQGVPDPDALVYLHPAHRHPCNVARKARPITPALRDELRARRIAEHGPPSVDASARSPRFASRVPDFLHSPGTPGRDSCPPSPGHHTKTGGTP